MSGEAGVKVFCRFRPFNKREIELGADKAVDFKFTPNSCKLEEGTRASFTLFSPSHSPEKTSPARASHSARLLMRSLQVL